MMLPTPSLLPAPCVLHRHARVRMENQCSQSLRSRIFFPMFHLVSKITTKIQRCLLSEGKYPEFSKLPSFPCSNFRWQLLSAASQPVKRPVGCSQPQSPGSTLANLPRSESAWSELVRICHVISCAEGDQVMRETGISSKNTGSEA